MLDIVGEKTRVVAAALTKAHQATRMSYLQRILQPNERVLYQSRLHWLIYLPGVFLVSLAVVVAAIGKVFAPEPSFRAGVYLIAGLIALAGLISLGGEWIRRKTTEIAVTDRRVIFKRGLIRRHTIEMNMDKVESVDVDQSLLGRIFNYGTIVIHGTGSDVEPLLRIEDPLRFRSYVTTR